DILYAFFSLTDSALYTSYILSLHDALPICEKRGLTAGAHFHQQIVQRDRLAIRAELVAQTLLKRLPLVLIEHLKQQRQPRVVFRSEEHTSELQSREKLVCRLLLERTKTKRN